MKKASNSSEPIVIKKYANRRLYNTDSSTYVTLDDLANMVKQERDFLVYDAKSGEDITRSVLTQIIFEQEGKGHNLLPIGFLRQLIGFYDDSMQKLVPSYLEFSLESLVKEQEKLQRQIADAWGVKGVDVMQEQVQKNMVMFERALGLFNPFAPGTAREPNGSAARPDTDRDDKAVSGNELDALKDQLAAMQSKIDELSRK